MPRLFVNSMANFMIQGGIVSFTLQDQATRAQGGQPVQVPPEDVVDVVMREQDFANSVQLLNQYMTQFQQQTGKPLGAHAAASKAGAPQSSPKPGPAGQQGGGIKIRPKNS